MKCVIVEKPYQIMVKEIDIPRPRKNEVLIKVHASGICGTDVHITSGGFIAQYPIIIGHEFSGEVLEVGSDCKRIKRGDRVAVEPNIPCNNCETCLSNRHHFCKHMTVPGVTLPGGLAEYVCVEEIGVFDIGDIPYISAAFMEPLSCSLHASERLQIDIGEKILVMGAGPNGILQGKVHRLCRAGQIDYLEKNEFRANEVKKYGWGEVFMNMDAVPLGMYDAVIEATGVAMLASKAQSFVKPTGKVLIYGVPKKDVEISINAFDMFKNEISYIGSYTSKKDSMKALEYLKTEIIKVEDIISHTISLEEVPHYIEQLERGAVGLKKIMVSV